MEQVLTAANILLLVLILVTIYYAVQTKNMVIVMREQRYDAIRPLVLAGFENEPRPSDQKPRSCFCITNHGPGTAQKIHLEVTMEDTPIQPVVPIIDGLGPGKTRMLGYCGIDGNRLVKVEFKCIDILGNPIGPYTQYFGKHAVVIHEDNQNNSMVGSSD